MPDTTVCVCSALGIQVSLVYDVYIDSASNIVQSIHKMVTYTPSVCLCETSSGHAYIPSHELELGLVVLVIPNILLFKYI